MTRTPTGRLSRTPARLTVAVLLALMLVAGCTGGGGEQQTPAPSKQLHQLITHLQARDLDKAAAMTSDPGVAGQMLAAVMSDLHPTDLRISAGSWDRTSETTAEVPVTYTWQLSDAGIWEYRATWTWTHSGSGEHARWTLDWSPTVIHPDLGARQTLAVRTTDADSGVLVDRDNRRLVHPVTVFAVQANPNKIADPEAFAAEVLPVVRRFDKTLTTDGIVAGLADADPAIGYTVINLREQQFTKVQQQLADIDGLSFPSSVRELGPTKDFARTVLSQLEPVVDELNQGRPGWRIVSVDASGAEVRTLAKHEAEPGAKVMVTLDIDAQTAAEKILSTVPEQAALVAIQPSTGEILAIAQNSAANADGPIALMGQYPPGSIFKIVTATAAIDNKLITPTTVVPCPGEWTIDYRPVHNEGFELGDVPATTAFAKSCNTTFAQLASELPDDALNETAKQYSIGLDFVVPGITTLTGQAPLPANQVEKAEDGFGQGVILVTPFSAALMAATAATGNMPVPTLVRGQKTTVDQKVPARSKAARKGLRTMMRAVVTEGTATSLADAGTVYAKTGTAEYNDDAGDIHAHAWTVGFRGDLAFSVLIVGGDTSTRTNDVAERFLEAYQGP